MAKEAVGEAQRGTATGFQAPTRVVKGLADGIDLPDKVSTDPVTLSRVGSERSGVFVSPTYSGVTAANSAPGETVDGLLRPDSWRRAEGESRPDGRYWIDRLTKTSVESGSRSRIAVRDSDGDAAGPIEEKGDRAWRRRAWRRRWRRC